MDTNRNLLNEDLQVDSIAITHLKETAMWSKLFAIVGLVISVILAIAAFFMGALMESLSGGFYSTTGSTLTLTLTYLVIAAVYFFLSLFMLRFAGKMKEAILTINQDSFNVALQNQKMAYRIMGIITIIYLLFLVLALVVGIGAAMFVA
ncbi:MAG TPA: hypothetical protein PK504_05190 [Ferruginibacter sp.]|nr:hypothetical protein [Ferruginibacter sp.]HRE63970.1 hypothetical protein [Ferruginibacter sp.]